jgi:hypothetical protein
VNSPFRLQPAGKKAENVQMEQIVITDRTMARVLAVLPAIVVAIAVRVLTLGQPPLAARVGAAAAIALSSWVAYRLLTARVVVDETGLEIRGVFHEGHVLWSELDSVETRPASLGLRLLVWGVIKPHGLVLRGRSRTLRPIAAVCRDDDEDLMRALGAIKVRLGAWGVPSKQEPESAASL